MGRILGVRRTLLLLASMGLAMLLASGLAFAANIKGDGNDNVLTGTSSRDTINPFGGNDRVYALERNDSVRHSYGNDYILGGTGDDTLRGGFDNDHIWGGPGRDLIDCAYLESRDKGEGWDVAHAELGQDTVVDCNEVRYDDNTGDATRISRIDPLTGEPTLTQ
jgi:Ca2+-binding RTX toxin-like protein